jgi:hypothetical protein
MSDDTDRDRLGRIAFDAAMADFPDRSWSSLNEVGRNDYHRIAAAVAEAVRAEYDERVVGCVKAWISAKWEVAFLPNEERDLRRRVRESLR